ncbi:MAG: RagB/SusD family nutrient uptake outer membrane protein [bacterium]
MRITLRHLVLLAAPVASMACEGLTDIQATDIVQPASLATAAGAEAQRAGAMGTFFTTYGGGVTSVVIASGLISDEFYAGFVPSTASTPDFRTWSEPSSIGPYVGLQRTRVAALVAIDGLKQYLPSPRSKTGQMYAIAGYTETMLAETVCSGIPLGTLSGGGTEFGTPLSTADILALANQHFDSALVYAADSARILNLARIGKGRALLDDAKYAAAAAAVTGVPTSYVYNAEYSAAVTGQGNQVYNTMTAIKLLGVSDKEGTNGLDFRSANDPRVAWSALGKAADNATDQFVLSKMSSLAVPIVVASGVEARLIEAEAQLNAGNAAGALATLNALRASAIAPALAALTLEPDVTTQANQLFRERAFWLFGTGHRQGDLRRLIRQYNRAPESVFPTGAPRPGSVYGPQVAFVPDVTATNNPAYKACASLGA